MKNSNFLLILFVLLVLACKKQDNDKVVDSCYMNSNALTILHNDIEREYVLYVPNSYDNSSSTPLMMNFHGFGGGASDFMGEADMRSLAEQENFIIVYPQGSCLNNFSHWNSCPLSADNKSTADDLGFVEIMISEISSNYNIDMERIYAAGYSNGGMMVYGLANYKSNLIAAVASVSGSMLDCIGVVNHPMPVINLHGTLDDVIPYNGNSDYAPVNSTIDHWLNFNNISNTPAVSSEVNGSITIEKHLYGQGDNGVSVEVYKYIGGDHVWFNTTFEGKNASELVWDFVSKYDINGLR
jgi:polyhydroxybutyrate depolymerase